MFLHSLNFGAITGGALILLSLLVYLLDLSTKNPLNYLAYFIFICGMVIGIKTYRDNVLGGYISYGNAFLSAFYIGLIAAFIGSVFTFIMVKWIDPSIVDRVMEQAEETMLEKYPDMSQDQMDTALAMTRKFTNPVWMAFWGFVSNVIVSLILALIIAIFMKKNNDSFEAAIGNNE